MVAGGEAQGTPCFTLVCLRQLEEEIPLHEEGDIQESALSHDRRLLSLRDGRGRCFCYSCDAARPAFLLRRPVAENVEQDVWLHLPAEKSVLLRENALTEYPGMPCLVALQKGNLALSICIFVQIESREAAVVDRKARAATSPAELAKTRQLLTWEEELQSEELPPNTVWRYTVPLAELLILLPNCQPLLEQRQKTSAASQETAAGPAGESEVDMEAEEGSEQPAASKAGQVVDGSAGLSTSPGPHEQQDAEQDLARICQQLQVRFCAAKPSSLALVLEDTACVLLEFSRHGVYVSQCFYLQRPELPVADPPVSAMGSPNVVSGPAPSGGAATGSPLLGDARGAPTTPPSTKKAVQFCDVTACQEWIFAITQPPSPLLLIWSLTGIAFHAISLADYVGESTTFRSLVVALDLLGLALCDSNHDVWILSLNEYFEGSPKGLDWELLKERQRCAECVGLLDQTGKLYQEVSCFPEAFGLSPFRHERGPGRAFTRRPGGSSSVMDCLVEGVPTYGIPIPGGAFGVGDRLFGEVDGPAEPAEPRGTRAAEPVGDGLGLGGSGGLRCSPLAWHERISQTHEWHEVDRRWAIARAQRLKTGSRGDHGGACVVGLSGRAAGIEGAMNMLNGFSVPAQHRLGDDDLHYSLCAAVRKHAQRQFESRLPPWLSHVKLQLKAQRFNPPMLGKLWSEADQHEDEVDSDSEDEAEANMYADQPTSPARSGIRSMDMNTVHNGSLGLSPSNEASIAALRQDLTNAMGGHQGGRANPARAATATIGNEMQFERRHRAPFQVARVKLSITSTDIFCEIWRKRRSRDGDDADKRLGVCPWGVCVIPRLSSGPAEPTAIPQVDHLTGGLLDPLFEGGNGSAPLTGTKRELTTLRSRRRWMSVVTQNHIWYMLNEDGRLYALLLRQSPVRVISNLLVFEQRAKASHLCALNGWNATQLPVLTLFLGLRFRELNEIRVSLGSLRPHQEMEACQMVMDFIHAGYSCAYLTLPFSPSSPRGRANENQSAALQQPSQLPQSVLVQRGTLIGQIHGQQVEDGRNEGGNPLPTSTSPLATLQTAQSQLQHPAFSHAPQSPAPANQHSHQAGQTTCAVLQAATAPASACFSSPGGGGTAATGAPAVGSQLPADRSFVSRLLEIAMQFVTKLIQTRVLQIQGSQGACRALTYLQPAHAASEAPAYAAMVNELSQLTVHMQSLRGLQQQLIWSFADGKAYDGGVVIQCPAQEPTADEKKNAALKAEQSMLDAPLEMVSKTHSDKRGSAKEQMTKMRSTEHKEAIVRNALIFGRVSSALIWFHELALEEGRGGSGGGSRVFLDFRVTAGRLAYQLVCNQQVDFLFVAMHMLRNVGESVNRFFKAVAFHTAKRLVRRRLLKHLKHMSRLTKEEQDLICLVNLLELFHTNPCYTTEFNRMTTSLTTGRYPQRAYQKDLPPFCTWPAGGRTMLMVGLSCDGAIGGGVSTDHITGDAADAEMAYEQLTSSRELPISQRMPLELHDMWAGYQTPVMAAMLEVPADARRAWSRLPCGDVDDLDAQPVLGLANFHKASNLEGDQEAAVADFREMDGGDGEADGLLGPRSVHAGSRTTCRHCQKEGLKDDVEFEMPRFQTENGGSDLCDTLGLGGAHPKHHVMGYLHVTLSWMRKWSWSTRARILMEKTYFQPHLIESLPWLQPPREEGQPEQAWRKCWLDFLVAHQDWRGLASWVRCMPLDRDDRVDSHGMSRVDLTHLEERGLPGCTNYTREILLQELGRRGIYCHADTQSFPTLLRRLAQCGRLFEQVRDNDDEHGTRAEEPASAGADGANIGAVVLALERLLPSRKVCPFHQFFIHLCIDRDLPTVMLLYMQNYKLGATMSDLKALQLRHSSKPWASLLLVGRLGNAHLFAASLQHASIVFGETDQSGVAAKNATAGKSSAWRDAEDVPFMPLNGLAGRSPKAFLATLMFAPVASAYVAADAPLDSPWHLDLGLLWQVVQEYPTLREALFPPDAPMLQHGEPKLQWNASQPRKLDTSLVESVAEASADQWAQGIDTANDVVSAEVAAQVPLKQQLPRATLPANTSADDNISKSDEKQRLVGPSRRMLDDMLTFKEDVSLSDLLSDVAAFDVRHALRPLPIFQDTAEDNEDISKATEDGSLAGLVELRERFCDELGEGYFLAQGRAMMAFHVLLTKCARRASPSAELRFPLVLPPEETRRLHKVAKSVALYNLLNEGVVSSAVCLLELCSLETEMLRVDVQAAKRIYEHNIRRGDGSIAEDWDRSRQAAANVIELFLSFPDIEDIPSRAAEAAINSGHLLTALRMLEESTWALDPHPSAPSVSSLQALAYDSPWHLVALFCRVHSLPRSLTLLHELARNNDWVMFLHESDLQQCPADTVLDIVDGYFTDTSLQSHLRILARSIAVQEQDDHAACHLKAMEQSTGGKEVVDRIDRQPEEPRTEDAGLKQRAEPNPGRTLSRVETDAVADAIGFLEQCRVKDGGGDHHVGTGWGLLRHALNNRAARLAVVASAFSDVTPLQCMAVWLSVNTERSQTPAAQTEAASTELAAQSSPAEVATQIATLCRRSSAFSLVLRALKIFDPANPLVDFVKFHRAFVQCRFQSCRGHLKRFVKRRDSESRSSPQQKAEGSYCLELVPHVVTLSEEMVQYLLDGFPQARMMLLSALDQANFSPHYSHLFRSFRLIQQAGLDVDFRVPAGELLQLLISRKMFAEAREWARSSGIVGDTIVFEEVTGMIVEFRQGVWWNVLDERLQLWHECYCAFMRQSYPPVGAALFFLDITSKLEPDLFAREQLMLLCIAFELLSGHSGDDDVTSITTADASSPRKQSTEASRQQLATSKEQLSRIKLSMLLILTGTNKDLAAELDFAPLDLSYGTLRTLARRIPEGVQALPLYSTEGSGGAAAISGVPGGGGAQGGGGAPAWAPEQTGGGPRSELLPYLDTAISSLINCDEIAWAKRLAQGFGFASVDLHLAEVLEKVASGNHQEALLELTLGRAHPELPNVEDGDAEPLLKSLCTQCSKRVALFCRRCQVFYAVSRTIGMHYRQVSQVDVGELLDRLLSPRPYMGDIALCRSLLSCYPKALNKAMLAEVLAQRFLRSTLNLGGLEWPEDKLDEFVSLLDSTPELLGDAALRGIPQFRHTSEVDGRARNALAEEESEDRQAVDDSNDTSPAALQAPLPLECEAEVLIMAYRAYVQACHERSIGELLQFLESRAEVYVEHGRFALLVRLLVAIPEYHAMEYMFGYLVRHGQLDLLLEKGRVPGRVAPALPVALVRYLHDHFPRNLELLAKVHRCFGLEAQLADLLGHKAKVLAESIGRKWEYICSEEGEEKLLMCLSLFLQCSRFYLRGKRYQKHLVANELAALISLQLKAVQIHLAASLQEQQQQAAAAALRKSEREERKALALQQARREEAIAALGDIEVPTSTGDPTGSLATAETAAFNAAVEERTAAATNPTAGEAGDAEGNVPADGVEKAGGTTSAAAEGNAAGVAGTAAVGLGEASDTEARMHPAAHSSSDARAAGAAAVLEDVGDSHAVSTGPGEDVPEGVAPSGASGNDGVAAMGGAVAASTSTSAAVDPASGADVIAVVDGSLAVGMSGTPVAVPGVGPAQAKDDVASGAGPEQGDSSPEAVDTPELATSATTMSSSTTALAVSSSSVAAATAQSAFAAPQADTEASSDDGPPGQVAVTAHTVAQQDEGLLATCTAAAASVPTNSDENAASLSTATTAPATSSVPDGASAPSEVAGVVAAATPDNSAGNVRGGAVETASAVEDEDELDAGGVAIGSIPLGPMGDPFVVINLKAAEVRVFAEYHHDFIAAFQVVSAYIHTFGQSLSTVWPKALYRQVVLLGNRGYLQQFLRHLPLHRDALEATANLYLDEPCPEQFPLRAQRMKQFLCDGVRNLETLYQLTRSLGHEFSDIAMETASLVYMA